MARRAKTQPAEDSPAWNQLNEGDHVSLRTRDGSTVSGTVDTYSRDGSLLWLQLAGGKGRKLFERTEINQSKRLKDMYNKTRRA